MARRLLSPEQATSWEEFHDRYLREWSYRNNRPRSLRYVLHVMAGLFLLIIAVVFATYAAGPHGLWWQWLGVALPAVIVIRMLIRAWQLGSRDSARLRELDRLQQEWQGRLDRGEIPRPPRRRPGHHLVTTTAETTTGPFRLHARVPGDMISLAAGGDEHAAAAHAASTGGWLPAGAPPGTRQDMPEQLAAAPPDAPRRAPGGPPGRARARASTCREAPVICGLTRDMRGHSISSGSGLRFAAAIAWGGRLDGLESVAALAGSLNFGPSLSAGSADHGRGRAR